MLMAHAEWADETDIKKHHPDIERRARQDSKFILDRIHTKDMFSTQWSPQPSSYLTQPNSIIY